MTIAGRIDGATLDRYRALRYAGKSLATKLTRAMPKSVIISAARQLGLWKKGVLVAEEHEVDVLMDRAVYDEKWDGRSALDHFLETLAATDFTENERRYGEIMKSARFWLFQVARVEPGSRVTLVERPLERQDRENSPTFDVIDLEMSSSMIPGVLVAARLLDAGAFSLTSGVVFPFHSEREPVIMAHLKGKAFGSRRRRIDQPDRYSIYFHELHRRFGVPVRYADVDQV